MPPEPASTDVNPAERATTSPRAGILISVLLVLGLFVGLHVYIGLRLLSATELSAPSQVLGWLLLAGLFLSIPALFTLKRRASPLSRWVQPVAYGWLGTFGVLITALLAVEVVRGVTGLFLPPPSDAARLRTERLIAGAVVASVAVLVAWAYRVARGRATVERVEVTVPRLGAGLDGLRIVQVSDIHIGEEGLDRRFLERMVEQVHALEPDVVAITGDLIDGTVEALRPELAPLSSLCAKHGVYYVTGNHEYYWGGPVWEAEVRRHGITVLHNEHRVLERGGARLVLGGVTDFDGGHFSAEDASRPDLAFAGAPEGVPRVLLAHQPRSAEAAARAGVDLQLSGHTHGGQIFPFNFFVRLQQPVVRGLKRLFGIWVYTHRGTGYWGPPMRLGPPPEIAVITLRS